MNELEVVTVAVEDINMVAKMFDFDFDFNGNNGLEYTSKQAKENGFDSDMEYAIDLANKKGKNLVESIHLFIGWFVGLGVGYYDMAYNVLEANGSVVVSLAYKSIEN